jgi:hypothetical protein
MFEMEVLFSVNLVSAVSLLDGSDRMQDVEAWWWGDPEDALYLTNGAEGRRGSLSGTDTQADGVEVTGSWGEEYSRSFRYRPECNIYDS